MKKSRDMIALFLVCVLFLTACGKDRKPAQGEPGIYYVNVEGTGLVKEEIQLKGTSAEEQVRNVLKAMRRVEDTTEYQSAFAEEAKLEKWELSDECVKLYFDDGYEKLSGEGELLLRAAVVQTLTQIDGVDDVRFFIEDEPLKDQHGCELGAMNAEDFVENTGSSLHSYQVEKFRLYFSNAKGDRLGSETVKVRYNSNTSREKVIVEKILKGPGKDGNFPVISPNTEVRSVSVKDGICYVNFNEEFLNTDYKVDPYVTIYALVNSIVENCATGQVQILVNGETKVTYQSSVDLSQPFAADYDYVEKKD